MREEGRSIKIAPAAAHHKFCSNDRLVFLETSQDMTSLMFALTWLLLESGTPAAPTL
jgi:hypothetical protein